MKERIKKLRKEALRLTQAKFGEKLGIGQQSVAAMENGGTITERNFDAICRVWSVNPEWLRYGIGEMFLPETVDTYLDKVVAEKNLSAGDKVLIKSILELTPEARQAFINWAEKLVDEVHVKSTEQAIEDERRTLEKTIADAQKRLAELNSANSWAQREPAHKCDEER